MALCVWWPGFELELERVRMPSLVNLALALPSPENHRAIGRRCSFASADGVEPGMLLSHAIALCPSLVLCKPDPDFYDVARERILEVLRLWSPVVECSRDRGRFFVGVDGLERLYGSPQQQMEMLRVRLEELAPRLVSGVRFGYAPGKFAAWAAVRLATGPTDGEVDKTKGMTSAVYVAPSDLSSFLSQQPVDVLPVSPRMIQRLHRLGIKCLGHLIVMSEQGLVTQFGVDGRRALMWAKAERIDRVKSEPRERPIRVMLDFPVPISRFEILHSALDQLLGWALSHSGRRGKSVRGIKLSAQLEDGGSWSIRSTLRDPTSKAERLGVFLRSRIALSPPSCAVTHLRLEFFRFGPESVQADLFDPKENVPRVIGSIDTKDGELLPAFKDAARQLRLRLGGAAVYRVFELEPTSRLPEHRYALMEL